MNELRDVRYERSPIPKSGLEIQITMVVKKHKASPAVFNKMKELYWSTTRSQIERHFLVKTQNTKKTNRRCEHFQDRELPLPTWLVTRMQVLYNKSRKIEPRLDWVERS